MNLIWTVVLVMSSGLEMQFEASPELCIAVDRQENPGHYLMPDGTMEFPVTGYCLPPDPCECVDTQEASS